MVITDRLHIVTLPVVVKIGTAPSGVPVGGLGISLGRFGVFFRTDFRFVCFPMVLVAYVFRNIVKMHTYKHVKACELRSDFFKSVVFLKGYFFVVKKCVKKITGLGRIHFAFY